MANDRKNSGFSLTEVLMSVGILAIGMIFVAGVFPVGIHFTTVAAERTIAAVVADEAFAKIRLYRDDINDTTVFDETVVFDNPVVNINLDEFTYPSTDVMKRYSWLALCRRTDSSSRFVQVTVFVSRTVGSSAGPIPQPVAVSGTDGAKFLTITDPDYINSINDGYTIMDDATGQLYRVLQRSPESPERIELNRNWSDPLGAGSGFFWTIPPTAGGRYPCIAVYQKVIGF